MRSAGSEVEPRMRKTNTGLMANYYWTLDPVGEEDVPVPVHLRALVLQEDDLPRVMPAHLSVGVVDDAELIISAK